MLGKSSCDWLIVGLGNPGKQYDGTRHNCGFLAIDHLAEALQVKIDRVKFRGLTAMATYEGQKLCLLKPETFMNLSGIAVMQAANFYKIPPERVLVLFDDISLPVGRVRVRGNGSAGGHNGIKSIIGALQSQDFPRVKVGVGGKPDADYDPGGLGARLLFQGRPEAAGHRAGPCQRCRAHHCDRGRPGGSQSIQRKITHNLGRRTGTGDPRFPPV